MSFAEELGIRNHDLVAEGPGLESIAGPDRYRRAYRHDGAGPRTVRDDARDLVNLSEIGVSVGPHRRTDGDENDVRAIELGVGLHEPDGRLTEQLPDARLPEGILAPLESREPGGIALDADHFMPDRGEGERAREADVSGADDRQAHRRLPTCSRPAASRSSQSSSSARVNARRSGNVVLR